MQPRTRRRSNRLSLIRGLLGLMLVADFLYIALLLRDGGAWFPFAKVSPGDALGPESLALRRHPELNLEGLTVQLEPGHSLVQRLLLLTEHGLATTIVTIPMIIFALRVANHAIAYDPFTPGMVRRLRLLGIVVLVGGGLAEVAEYVAGNILIEISLPKDVAFMAGPDVRLTFWWLLIGFVLLSIAEVVRRGCALRDELDSVI